NTSDEPRTGAKGAGAAPAMPGKASIATPETSAKPITSVRRTSSSRDVRICSPFTMMNVTVNSNAGRTTERGMTANNAVIFGRNPRTMNIAPTANATTRLVTPVAADSPTAGVDVLVPVAPATPAKVVARPSANTPPVTDRISGRTQLASLIR